MAVDMRGRSRFSNLGHGVFKREFSVCHFVGHAVFVRIRLPIASGTTSKLTHRTDREIHANTKRLMPRQDHEHPFSPRAFKAHHIDSHLDAGIWVQ